MKTTLSRTLRNAILCLVLLASAIPCAVLAQSDAAKEITVTLAGNFDGQDDFVFMGNTIRFRHISSQKPAGVTVNGKPWEDLNKPFELDLTPDFAKAAIVEKQGRGAVDLIVNPDRFTLVIDDREASSAPYRVTIAVKNQIRRPPPPPVNPAAARRELTPRRIMDMEEQAAKLPKGSGPSIDGSTDGMDHPDFMVSRPVPMYRHDRRVEIKGTVDQWASFRIQGNSVFYQNYRTFRIGTSGAGPVLKGGKFPSGVTIDGKSWSNLTRPFTLDFTPPVSSEKDIFFRAEQCEIEYANHDDVIEFTITNKGGKPVPFEVLWLIRDSSAQ